MTDKKVEKIIKYDKHIKIINDVNDSKSFESKSYKVKDYDSKIGLIRTPELWPIEAKKIIITKGICQARLEESFSKVVFPWNSSYNNYRVFYEHQIQEFPLFVVVLKEYKEASKVLNLAYKFNLQIRIVNGRHSSAIENPDIYVDMSQLRKIKLLKRDQLLVQGGATQGEVYEYLMSKDHNNMWIGGKTSHPLSEHSLFKTSSSDVKSEHVFPGGSAYSVGVPGITSAGGLGTLKRTFGLACDYVKEWTIALPYGSNYYSTDVKVNEIKDYNKKSRIIKVKKGEDLDWALKGGVASNFGIVLDITFKLLPKVDKIISFAVEWPDLSKHPREAAKILDTWQLNAPKLSSWYNTDIVLFTSKGELHTRIVGSFVVPNNCGDDPSQEFLPLVKQDVKNLVKDLYPPLSLEVTIDDYDDTVEKLFEARPYAPFSNMKIALRKKSIKGQEIVNHLLSSNKHPGTQGFQIELLGGVLNKTNLTSTNSSFYPRDANYLMETFARWESALNTCENISWIDQLFYKLVKSNYAYIGFPVNGLPIKYYYGSHRHRLREIKKQVDPLKQLRFLTGIDK